MSGIFFCDKLRMKVDENNNIPDSKQLYGVHPYKVPKVYLAGLGNVDYRRGDNWNNDSVVLVQDEGIIEYTQSSAEGYMVTEYDFARLVKKEHKVVLDKISKFDSWDFYRVGDYLGGEIMNDHYVVNNGVLKQCVGVIYDLMIPNAVINIDESAFCDYQCFESILIPEGLVDIPDSFFKHCSAKSISVADGNPQYYVESGCLIDRYAATLVLGSSSCIIPGDGTVTKLGANAFTNCIGIERIMIPETVTEIESGAFRGCYWLDEVIMPDTFADRLEDIFGEKFVKEGGCWKRVRENNVNPNCPF